MPERATASYSPTMARRTCSSTFQSCNAREWAICTRPESPATRWSEAAGQDVRGCASGALGRYRAERRLFWSGVHAMLRGTMTTHKFAVGQAVTFSPDRDQEHTKGELFKVVRLLPEAGDALQYRVKSQTDGHERVVREDQLARS